MTDTILELSGEPRSDPDARATITDFLDYTEFFPSDLFRSLTLIGRLDESYERDAAKIHELTKTYGSLPNLPPVQRPDPQTLRQDISAALDHAIRCRESSFAEASRLCNVADSLYHRLAGITKKLHALPKPPSRDPTPVPQPRSPNLHRVRRTDVERPSRITLILDRNRPGANGRSNNPIPKPNHRIRRIMVPGAVMPPYDLVSPGASVVSDSESDRPASLTEITMTSHSRRPDKPPKLPKTHRIKLMKPPRVRLAGAFGTNVHSAVAGISVSNALLLCETPPQDAPKGSRHAPWFDLTHYEKNILRKRMKKNAGWEPSDTMVRRELADKGRGNENYLIAIAHAQSKGEELMDEPPDEGKPIDVPDDELGETPSEIHNQGMDLYEAVNSKSHKERAEAAILEAQGVSEREEIEEAGELINNAQNIVIKLLGKIPSVPNQGPITLTQISNIKADPPKFDKKRKRVASPEPEVDWNANDRSPAADESMCKPAPKKLKLVTSADVGISSAFAPQNSTVGPVLNTCRAPQAVMTAATTKVSLGAAGSSISLPVRVPQTPPVQSTPSPELTFLSKPSSPTKHAIKNKATGPVDDASPIELYVPKFTQRSSRSSTALTKAPMPEHTKSPVLRRAAHPHSDEMSTPARPDSAISTMRPRSRGSKITSLIISNKKAASAEPPPTRAFVRRHIDASAPPSRAAAKRASRRIAGEGEDEASSPPAAPEANRRSARAVPAPTTTHSGHGRARPSRDILKNKPPPDKKNAAGGGGGGGGGGVGKHSSRTSAAQGHVAVDADEEIWCTCRSVSWGQMIACDNDDCKTQWYHLECLAMDKAPRNKSWYCPDCRVELEVGEFGEKIPAEAPRRGRSGGGAGW